MDNLLKRLFLAVPLDEENIRLSEEFIKANETLPVKWISRDNWHITTVFLGDFQETLISQLKSELKNIFKKQTPFDIEFDRFCLAPDKRNPRMIWAKYKSCNNYDRLVYDTFSGLKKFYRENKLDFNISLHKHNIPHVTLSRLRTRLNVSLNELQSQLMLNVKTCILFESVLRTQGAQYLIIKEFTFSTDIL